MASCVMYVCAVLAIWVYIVEKDKKGMNAKNWKRETRI